MGRCRALRSPLRHQAQPWVEAGKGVGRAPGIGNGRAGAQADASELLDQDRERRSLSSVKMICACGVDDDSVRWISRDDWGEALQHPEREPLQRFGVGGRIGVLDYPALHERLGLACGHADAEASGLGCLDGRWSDRREIADWPRLAGQLRDEICRLSPNRRRPVELGDLNLPGLVESINGATTTFLFVHPLWRTDTASREAKWFKSIVRSAGGTTPHLIDTFDASRRPVAALEHAMARPNDR
jgi:hypothetical protein